MRVLLVGLGGAGTRVADRMADAHAPNSLWERIKRWFFPPDLDLEVLAVDAPEAGQGQVELRRLDRDDVVDLGDGAGTGGDLGAGTRAWRRDAENLRSVLGETEPWDLAVVVGAVGGGTSGATLGPVADTLASMGHGAPVVAAPILPFDDEADRIYRNAAPALARLRDADPLATFLLSNEQLGTREGRLSDVYAQANDAVAGRLRLLLDMLSGPGLRATDLGALETTMGSGSGFGVLGYAHARHDTAPADVVAEALSSEAASAATDPPEEARRVLLLARGDPSEFSMDALLDRAREALPDREVLLGVRASGKRPLEVLAVVALDRSQAVRAVLDRHEEILAAAEAPEEDAIGERLEEIPEPEEAPGADEEPGEAEEAEDEAEPEEAPEADELEPDEGTQEEAPEADEGPDEDEVREEGRPEGDEEPDEEDDESPEWVEDYRAAQQRAKELDIKANKTHDELIEQIREAQEGDDP